MTAAPETDVGAAPSRRDCLEVAGGSVEGTVLVPGDKSISHRAAILAALANGVGEVDGFLEAADTASLLDALAALGVGIERPAPGVVRVHGVGGGAFDEPADALDFGNSGTALRLMAGVLAGRGTRAVLTGDASLRSRPMRRIVEPLRAMGADVITAADRAPLELRGGRLTGIDHRAPVASAQVASCVLLAGLHADGRTRVTLPAPARDHTERLLGAYGIDARDGVTRVDFAGLAARRVRVPRDASQAAFVAAAAALGGTEVRLPGVGANAYRTAFLDVLARMGAAVRWSDVADVDGEPVGELVVRGGPLRGTAIAAHEVPALIDELPVLMVVAAFADGPTTLDGAVELRYKESDRLAAVAAGLDAMGARVDERPDGLVVHGGGAAGGPVDARGDHRVAMAFAVAGTRVPVTVRDAAAVATSWPRFVEDLAGAGLGIRWCR